LNRRAALNSEGIINATHHEIANDLNVSREAVSCPLKMLERDGSITLNRNKIQLVKRGL